MQAGTFALLAPTLSFFKLPEWECPSNIGYPEGYNASLDTNYYIEVGSEEHREIWMKRLRVVSAMMLF